MDRYDRMILFEMSLIWFTFLTIGAVQWMANREGLPDVGYVLLVILFPLSLTVPAAYFAWWPDIKRHFVEPEL